MVFTPKAAWDFIGGLSTPSKMPCYSYSISALDCQIGRKLAEIPDSVCNKCYAVRGNYLFDVVKNAHARRLQSMRRPEWVTAATIAIGAHESSGFFRWFDSGDVQDLEMLEKICRVCENLPHIQFWLPTKQYNYVSQYKAKHGAFPKNLTVRLSAYMIGAFVGDSILNQTGAVSSAVVKTDEFNCPSSRQGGKCLSCRKCWNKQEKTIKYKYH